MQPRQQSWPTAWMMTDERLGGALWQAISHLPRGSGIVFRHYSLTREARCNLAMQVAKAARERGLLLAIAADAELAAELRAGLVHNPVAGNMGLPFSRSVHNVGEAEAASREGASLLFVSPVHPTRSHPGMPAFGVKEAIRIAIASDVPAVALGGMNASKFAPLQREGFHGWAGIDAWLSVRT